jgi:hypothetical protein
MDVSFPTQSAVEILIKPSSVIWQPQQLRELQERGDSVRKGLIGRLIEREGDTEHGSVAGELTCRGRVG